MTGTDSTKAPSWSDQQLSTVFSGGIDGNIALWQIPPHSQQVYEDLYHSREDSSIARQVAVWDKCHEGQPIWDLKLNHSTGKLITVGSDSSVGLWRSPSQDEVDN